MRDHPGLFRMFSNIPDSPSRCQEHTLSVPTKTVSRHFQMILGGEIVPGCEPLCQKHSQRFVDAQRIESFHIGKTGKWCWSWILESIPSTNIVDVECLLMHEGKWEFPQWWEVCAREQHNVLGELSSIWYFDLWPVGWAAGKWSHRVKDDHCREGLGPPAQGIRGLEFTLWVLRGYGKILSKKFLRSNHTDCVYSWQNSLLKSQTSCQLLSGPQQRPLCPGLLTEWIPQMIAQRWVPSAYSSVRKIHLCPFLWKVHLYNSCKVRERCCVCQLLKEEQTEMEEKSKRIKQFAELCFPDALISDF